MIVNRDRQLFQYRNAQRFNILIDGLYYLSSRYCPANLENFLSLDAKGYWLTQLATIYNVPRFYNALVDAFILDSSILDSADVLDGETLPINDTQLLALSKSRLLAYSGATKSIPSIYALFTELFDLSIGDMNIVETPKHIAIHLNFHGNNIKLNNYVALTYYNPKFFGCPAGVGVTYVIEG